MYVNLGRAQQYTGCIILCVVLSTSAAPILAAVCPSDKVSTGETARRESLAENMHIAAVRVH